MDSGTAMVKQVDLIFFDSFGDSVLEDLRGGGILKREDSFDHLVRVLEFS